MARVICEEKGEKYMNCSLAFTGLTISVGLGLCQIVTPCVGLHQIVTPSLLLDIADSDFNY